MKDEPREIYTMCLSPIDDAFRTHAHIRTHTCLCRRVANSGVVSIHVMPCWFYAYHTYKHTFNTYKSCQLSDWTHHYRLACVRQVRVYIWIELREGESDTEGRERTISIKRGLCESPICFILILDFIVVVVVVTVYQCWSENEQHQQPTLFWNALQTKDEEELR